MHLRVVTAQQLISSSPGRHKIDTIRSILQDFPQRKFILVGDSGEIDPEIYKQIYEEFPEQVIKILIHDVSSQRAMESDKNEANNDSYYNMVRKFISRESAMLRRDGSSSQFAMDAMAQTEIPEEQQQLADPQVPQMTKLEQFNARIQRVSGDLNDGTFSLFTLASQLLLDPYIAEEFLMNNKK